MPIKKLVNRLPLFVLGLAAAITLRLLTDNLSQRVWWDSDYAIFLVDMFHASEFSQQLGISSRFGWAHPGPLNYYILLPWYLLSNNGELGPILGTFLQNTVFILSSVYIIRKLSGRE